MMCGGGSRLMFRNSFFRRCCYRRFKNRRVSHKLKPRGIQKHEGVVSHRSKRSLSKNVDNINGTAYMDGKEMDVPSRSSSPLR